MSRIAALILAAGSSTRFGGDKLTQPVGGKPLLSHVVDAALAASLVEVVVVTRSVDDPVMTAIDSRPRLRFVPNPDHRQGMFTSLRCGLRAMHPSVDAAVVLLGDEPEVTGERIRTIVDAYDASGAPAARTRYRDRVGHPVVLGRALWPALLLGQGDKGARDVLAETHGVEVVQIEEISPIDVDTKDDLTAVRQRLSRT